MLTHMLVDPLNPALRHLTFPNNLISTVTLRILEISLLPKYLTFVQDRHTASTIKTVGISTVFQTYVCYTLNSDDIRHCTTVVQVPLYMK